MARICELEVGVHRTVRTCKDSRDVMAYVRVCRETGRRWDAEEVRMQADSILERAADQQLVLESDRARVLEAIVAGMPLGTGFLDRFQRVSTEAIMARISVWSVGMGQMEFGIACSLVPYLGLFVVKWAMIEIASRVLVSECTDPLTRSRVRAEEVNSSWRRRQARIDRSGNFSEYLEEQRTLVAHGKREMRWARDQMALEARRDAGS